MRTKQLLTTMILGLSTTTAALADATFTFTESANTVTVVGEGAFDITGLSPSTAFNPTSVFLQANTPSLTVGTPNVDVEGFIVDDNAATFTPLGPSSSEFNFSNETGDIIGFQRNDDNFEVFVPAGYVSGTPLSGLGTLPGTIDSLGLTPGTFTYSYDGPDGTGPSGTITVNVVPEPTSLALLGLGGLLLARRRRSMNA